MKTNVIYNEDCLEGMKKLPDNSIDSIVTDPPYNLKFMGKKWDDLGTPKQFQEWNEKWAKEALRVLKPGGYMIVFSGTKTYHRMVSGIEDAGFEVKDMIEWMYGSGFPKSYNISKGFDKQADAKREVTGKWEGGGHEKFDKRKYDREKDYPNNYNITKPATGKAKKWEGWGTALKPAHEPILLAQKPREGTYCENIEKYGVGGINIDECRVDTNYSNKGRKTRNKDEGEFTVENAPKRKEGMKTRSDPHNKGRFPANLLLTHHPACEYKGEKKIEGGNDPRKANGNRDSGAIFDNTDEQKCNNKGYADKNGMETVSDWDCHPSCPVRTLNEQSGISVSNVRVSEDKDEKANTYSLGRSGITPRGHKDKGGAARYFNQFYFTDEDFFKYQPKAKKSERTCDGEVDNDHPTVKPLELMKWLVRLVIPPEGIVVDPFCGSGTTLVACYEEGFNYIGIDSDKHSVEIAQERLKYHKGQPTKLELF